MKTVCIYNYIGYFTKCQLKYGMFRLKVDVALFRVEDIGEYKIPINTQDAYLAAGTEEFSEVPD